MERLEHFADQIHVPALIDLILMRGSPAWISVSIV